MKSFYINNGLHTFVVLSARFLCMLLLYTALRFGFYLFNQTLFSHVDCPSLVQMMIGGVKFDLVALLYLNALYIFMFIIPFPFKYQKIYQKIARWIFIITNSLGVALNLIDYAYYPFTLKRTTGTVFSQFSNESNLLKLFFSFVLDYWYLAVVFSLLVWVIAKISSFISLQKPIIRVSWRFYSIQVLAMLFVAFFFVGGVRGGWGRSTRPITLNNAGDFVKNPEEISIVLNTPFSILKTLNAVYLQEVNYFEKEKLQQIYPVLHYPKNQDSFKDLNVVVLIMESFGKENIGFFNRDLDGGKYKGYTPFLDSLLAESYTFNHSYANGRKSIDALPSIISGIPSIGEPYVLSAYSGNNTTSLAHLLSGKGYETAFFHGAPNGSMGFSAYLQLAGVQNYYGKNEYNNNADFDGVWGIWDEPFMQFMVNKIGEMKEPFFAGFFSLSSHHPFKVPEKYKEVFPKGPLPVHEPTGYSDYALRKFFERASKSSWFDQTLFVICADHSSASYWAEYGTLPNSFAIPIAFYYPAGNLKKVSDKLVQQIDIMPTILNYLNYDKPYFSFGFDAFDEENKHNFVINTVGESYNLFMGNYFMTYDGHQAKSLYDLRKDNMLTKDLSDQEVVLKDSLQQYVKAFIQQYNYGMVNNKLTADR